MYSTHNETKYVIAERFIRTLKTKIYKYMTSISKNVHIDKLDDIVNRYNNSYYWTIEMKLVDIKRNTFINSSKEINDKYLKFNIGDIVRISKYKNIFVLFEIGLTKIFWLKNLNTLCCGDMLLVILIEKKLLERVTKSNSKKKKDLRVEKVISKILLAVGLIKMT